MFFRTRPILKKIAYPALIFTTLYLTQHKPKNFQPLVDEALTTLKKDNLENINADILFRQMRILYEHSDEIPKSHVKLPDLVSIEIKNGGNAVDEWTKIAATIV